MTPRLSQIYRRIDRGVADTSIHRRLVRRQFYRAWSVARRSLRRVPPSSNFDQALAWRAVVFPQARVCPVRHAIVMVAALVQRHREEACQSS